MQNPISFTDLHKISKFHPVMHLTIGLEEFEDEWPFFNNRDLLSTYFSKS